jgi:nitrous oxide reductase accessory protein NosL
MKFVSMMSAVALASVLAACGTAQKDAATAPGAVKGKSDCSATCSDDAQIAPGAVGGKSDCGANDPLSID